MKDHLCPACKGEHAKPTVAFFNTGADPTKHYAAEVCMRCCLCNDVGTVSDEVNMRWSAGRMHRDERLRRGETLFWAANRLGIRPPQLSDYEHGYADLPSDIATRSNTEG